MLQPADHLGQAINTYLCIYVCSISILALVRYLYDGKHRVPPSRVWVPSKYHAHPSYKHE